MYNITGYNVALAATGITDRVRADEYRLEANPLTYVFLHQEKEVKRLFAHALEKEPEPIYQLTPEAKKSWNNLRDRAQEPHRPKNLKR